MPTTSQINKTEQGMAISGSLVFANISILLENNNGCIKQHEGDSFIVDCSEMRRIDSAGLALLLEWERQSKNYNTICLFKGLSDQAQSLIQAYHLESVIAA